jgi:predicted nucleic acid-binding protein
LSYVIDASVAVRWYLEEEQHPNADAVLERVIHHPENFAVPELFTFEVLAVLMRLHPEPLSAYTTCFIPIIQGGIIRYPMTDNVARLACYYGKKGITGYDASYLGLAEELDSIWLTFDAKAHKRVDSSKRSVCLSENLPDNW